jgi:hypothetical protein
LIPKVLLKERDDMMGELKELVNSTVPKDKEAVLVSKEYAVDIGVLSTSRQIIAPMKTVAKMLGPKLFWKLCKLNLSDLDRHLNEEQRSKILQENEGNKRSIKIKKLTDAEKKRLKK